LKQPKHEYELAAAAAPEVIRAAPAVEEFTSAAYEATMRSLSSRLVACRMCGSSDLELFLDLGLTPPADEFRTREEAAAPQVYYPLEVYLCMQCGLAQLGLVVRPEVLYQHDYPYESSTTQAGRTHFALFAKDVVARFGLGADDLAVDIGSNVGVLVQGFLDAGVRAVGVDPAPNIVEIARKNGIMTFCDFFGARAVASVVAEHGKAAVVTGTNVVAHIHDLDAMMLAVNDLLTPNGAFIVEAPHFLRLINSLEYDTIYHEHLSYLSAKPLVNFFRKHGLEVIDIVQMGIHGGSFRVFVARKGSWPVMSSVDQMVREEENASIHRLPTVKAFAAAVDQHRSKLVSLLLELRGAGKRLAGISAPAKGMTLLNYCNIGPSILEFVTEKTSLKIGRFTPGGRIPVLPDAALRERHVDYGLLLAWNFAEEIMANLKSYREHGGRFIVPIPTPRVV
jgi:SAM-dependent methyltransferase